MTCDLCGKKYIFSVLSKFGTMEEFQAFLEDNTVESWSDVCCCQICDLCRSGDQCSICSGLYVHRNE